MKGPIELGHGRIEQRAIRSLAIKPEQVSFPAIYRIIEVKRDSEYKSDCTKQSHGKRLFFSSKPEMLPEKALEVIRKRWNIENKNHHPRDATLLQDKCRCRTGNSAANLALLRGAVLTMWKNDSRNLPATAFIQKNNRNIDSIILRMNKNQRLTE